MLSQQLESSDRRLAKVTAERFECLLKVFVVDVIGQILLGRDTGDRISDQIVDALVVQRIGGGKCAKGAVFNPIVIHAIVLLTMPL